MTIKRILRALRAVEHHWIGDLLGATCLFGSLYQWLIISWAFQ